jgi:hypothetical protein
MDDREPDFPDPYRRLRAPAPTPPEEICRCSDRPPVKLLQALGNNPIRCMHCHGEVLPETLALPLDLADPVADWCSLYDAIDRLWLASGAYESWAGAELANLDSGVNRAGLALRARIDLVRRCFYWLFDEGVAHDGPTTRARQCPICSKIAGLQCPVQRVLDAFSFSKTPRYAPRALSPRSDPGVAHSRIARGPTDRRCVNAFLCNDLHNKRCLDFALIPG